MWASAPLSVSRFDDRDLVVLSAVAKVSRTHLRDLQAKRVEARSRAMANNIMLVFERWAAAVAQREARRAVRSFAKATDDDSRFEAELLRIFQVFGMRQFTDAGKNAAGIAGGDWVVSPRMVQDILREKEIKIQNLAADTRQAVQDSVRTILQEAEREDPRPSAGEIARRIRNQIHGPPDQRGSIFSSERAENIARTELVQSENTGTFHGYEVSHVWGTEWLSYPDDGRSGVRRHWEMNGEVVQLGHYFHTPLGHRLKYPGDPGAPIAETARCRCGQAPVMKPPQREV